MNQNHYCWLSKHSNGNQLTGTKIKILQSHQLKCCSESALQKSAALRTTAQVETEQLKKGYSAQDLSKVTAMHTSPCKGQAGISFYISPGAMADRNHPNYLTFFDVVKCNTNAKCCTPPRTGGCLPLPSACLEPKWNFWAFMVLATNLNHHQHPQERQGPCDAHKALFIPAAPGRGSRPQGLTSGIPTRSRRQSQQHSSSIPAGRDASFPPHNPSPPLPLLPASLRPSQQPASSSLESS